MQKLFKKRSIGLVLGSFFLIIIGACLIALTYLEVVRYLKLTKSNELQGIVTNKRTYTSSKGIRSYDIQYEFIVGETKYTGTDATGRENLWIGIPKEFFDTLEIDSKIPIAYSPENPKVNRPVTAPIGTFDIVAGGFLGFFLFAFGVFVFFGSGKRDLMPLTR